MCGIAGYIGKRDIDQGKINSTLDLMKNRGPDAQGYIKISIGDINVVLLHSRLSIIDLDKRSNQPFTIGDYTLIFNGEIYNYVELGEDLKRKGIIFRTNSDTEILLQYYILYGEKCVDYFEGMWSFAIYDKKTKNLFLSRDRFAEKPLYYIEAKDGFYFGSEIKFIKSLSSQKFTINRKQILRYLVNGYKSLYKTPDTFFEEIKELSYASNLIINNRLEDRINKYWMPSYSTRDMSINESVEGFRHYLLESIKIRLRSDVPISFCLSGGIDSSSLVSIAAKEFKANIHTFSIIDEDERYNELENIKATINDIGCVNTIIHIPKINVIERLKKLIEYHDVPLATITFFVHSFIMESVSQNGYKVVFAGHGADEFITGYYDHFNLHLYEMRKDLDYPKYLNDWKKYISNIVRNPYLKNPELYFENEDFRRHIFLNSDIFANLIKSGFNERFTETKFTNSLLRNRMLNELFHEAVRVILHEDDLNSMMFSVENRCPYLDSKLFNFAYSIPTKHLIQDGYGKFILREAMKGTLNDKVRLDRQKKGFNASINSIFDLNDPDNINYLGEDSPIYDFIDRRKFEIFLKVLNTESIPNSYSKFIFNFLNTKLFLEQNA